MKRCLRLNLEGTDEVTTVLLKYERLPEFCFVCGRLGHSSKECPDEGAKVEALQGSALKFGSWMRANQYESSKLRGSRVNSRERERGYQQEQGLEKGGLEERSEVMGFLKNKKMEEKRREVNPIAQSSQVRKGCAFIENWETESGEVVPLEGESGIKDSIQNTQQLIHLSEDVNFLANSGQVSKHIQGEEKNIAATEKVSELQKDTIMPVHGREEKEEAMHLDSVRMSTRKWKREAREVPMVGKVTSPIRKMIIAQCAKRRGSSEFSKSPKNRGGTKNNCKQKFLATQKGKEVKNANREDMTGLKRRKLTFTEEGDRSQIKMKHNRDEEDETMLMMAEPDDQACQAT